MLRYAISILCVATAAFGQFDPAVFKAPPAQYRDTPCGAFH